MNKSIPTIPVLLSDYLKLNGSIECLNEQIRLLNVSARCKTVVSSIDRTFLYDIDVIGDIIEDPNSPNRKAREVLLSNGKSTMVPFDAQITIFIPMELPKEFIR